MNSLEPYHLQCKYEQDGYGNRQAGKDAISAKNDYLGLAQSERSGQQVLGRKGQ
jgi:hypothetical protein